MTFNLIPWNRSSRSDIRAQKNPFNALQEEMNRTFDDFFNGFDSSLLPSMMRENGSLIPAVDIIENESNFKVEAELPGMEMGDLDINISENYLTIKGEKKSFKEDKEENYIRRERYYGTYHRMIALPDSADTEKAKATFNKGVLWVEIPKKSEAIKTSRKLQINAPE